MEYNNREPCGGRHNYDFLGIHTNGLLTDELPHDDAHRFLCKWCCKDVIILYEIMVIKDYSSNTQSMKKINNDKRACSSGSGHKAIVIIEVKQGNDIFIPTDKWLRI